MCMHHIYIYIYIILGMDTNLTHPQMNLLSFVNWIFLQISQWPALFQLRLRYFANAYFIKERGRNVGGRWLGKHQETSNAWKTKVGPWENLSKVDLDL